MRLDLEFATRRRYRLTIDASAVVGAVVDARFVGVLIKGQCRGAQHALQTAKRHRLTGCHAPTQLGAVRYLQVKQIEYTLISKFIVKRKNQK